MPTIITIGKQMTYYYAYRKSVGLEHVMFALLLILIFAGTLIIAATNSGPMILGTELNTNGHVEYMCLGNGCENFSKFHLKD